jgi:hypothetical protein
VSSLPTQNNRDESAAAQDQSEIEAVLDEFDPEFVGYVSDSAEGICSSLETQDRGYETSEGEAGFCKACDAYVPSGPDICLGTIPGVCLACCGHGGVCQPYVVFGEYPNGNWLMLEDDKALQFFALIGKVVYD